MAYMADQHTHSHYSMDSENPIDKMCEAAVAQGLSELVITDHLDINSNDMLARLESPFDIDGSYTALCAAREKYKGVLKVGVGVELGQAHDIPALAKEVLDTHSYDQVIGSVHNLRGMPDFYLMAFHKITGRQCNLFLEQYFKELEEIVDLGYFDTLAHLTYPLRYFAEGGHTMSLEPHMSIIKRIFEKLIAMGKALEVNTSGWRKDMGCTLPDYDILKLYYEMGGRLITVGSDAHYTEDIGSFIAKVYDDLKDIGFKTVCSFTNRMPSEMEI